MAIVRTKVTELSEGSNGMGEADRLGSHIHFSGYQHFDLLCRCLQLFGLAMRASSLFEANSQCCSYLDQNSLLYFGASPTRPSVPLVQSTSYMFGVDPINGRLRRHPERNG